MYFTRNDNEKISLHYGGVELGFRDQLNSMRTHEDSGERFTPLRSGGGSTSILRNNENPGDDLDSHIPHKCDIDLLDSNEIKELRYDDQWNEVLNMQVSSQDEINRLGQLRTFICFEMEKKIELTNKEVGTALRALLLTEPTIFTPIELFMTLDHSASVV
ncbi:hypothetical protein OUZ56_033882 [Daphnia magna]|uniref:Uncharacterized protein n=1 Tax=Daphnia magna TaxID=35525 RepID=A0ABR0BB72_9CRUS|nr:hypothetical protein OUZ56_033882 [Daphnia magna]